MAEKTGSKEASSHVASSDSDPEIHDPTLAAAPTTEESCVHAMASSSGTAPIDDAAPLGDLVDGLGAAADAAAKAKMMAAYSPFARFDDPLAADKPAYASTSVGPSHAAGYGAIISYPPPRLAASFLRPSMQSIRETTRSNLNPNAKSFKPAMSRQSSPWAASAANSFASTSDKDGTSVGHGHVHGTPLPSPALLNRWVPVAIPAQHHHHHHQTTVATANRPNYASALMNFNQHQQWRVPVETQWSFSQQRAPYNNLSVPLQRTPANVLFSQASVSSAYQPWMQLEHSHAPLFDSPALHGPAASVQVQGTSLGSPASAVHATGPSAMQFTNVWADDATKAFDEINQLLMKSSDRLIVAVDYEFAVPDNCRVHDGEPPTPEEFYSQTQSMVNGGDIVQIALVFATNVRILGTWQFNLEFSPSWRAPNHKGIEFMLKAGIDFGEHESRGIPRAVFSHWLSQSRLLCNPNITWLTFGGCNDFGFLIHYATGAPLGLDRQEFLRTARVLFPDSYDIRIFTKLGRCRPAVIHGGLSKVCKELQVNIAGQAHNSGHDALCTLVCLEKMSRSDPQFLTRITRYRGALYGVSDIDQFDMS